MDFEEDIYSENIEVQFVEKTRNEIKFSSIDDLKMAIDKDKIIINTVLDKEKI
jgi:riboflavin kinase/FMN adenylyltransferase